MSNPAMTADDIRALLREKLQDCSQADLATDLGISATYLNDVLHGHKEPGPGILVPLGLRRVVRYEAIA